MLMTVITFTFMHLADAFIQSIQVIRFHFSYDAALKGSCLCREQSKYVEVCRIEPQ